jgi:hypothetical protein
MKIRTNIHAGDALRNCQRQRDYWRNQAERMEQIANAPSPRPPQPPQPPNPSPNPSPNPVGGGWVGGVYYNDRSGWCG